MARRGEGATGIAQRPLALKDVWIDADGQFRDRSGVAVGPIQTAMATAIAACLAAGGGPTMAVPAPAVPYTTASANYVYYDPAASGTNSGTFANPYNVEATALTAWTAGKALLVKEGTTTTIGAVWVPGGSGGSATAASVLARYDAISGVRLFGANGLPVVLNAVNQSMGVQINNLNYVAVDGLTIKNANSGSHANIRILGSSSNCQITNCTLENAAQCNILAGAIPSTGITGTGNVIDGCTFTSSSQEAIRILQGASDCFSSINYNRFVSFGIAGIYIVNPGGSDAFTFSGTIAMNAIDGVTGTKPCISISVSGGAPKIYRNAIRRGQYSVLISTNRTASVDYSGLLVENNDLQDPGNFGVQFIGVDYTTARPMIQYNRILYCGSIDRGVTAGPSNYGRSVELWGSTSSFACRGVVIRHNYMDGSYNFQSDFTEGVGMGFDNYAKDCLAYGNYIANCEGQAAQFNTGSGCEFSGNIVVNPCCSTRTHATITERGQAAIGMALSPKTVVANNTIIGSKSARQRYGISGDPTYDSNGTKFQNNLITGFSVAGIQRATTNDSESYNVVRECPIAIVNGSNAALANGAGTQLVAAADLLLQPPLYVPPVGSICDGAGSPVSARGVSFAGAQLSHRTPIGATHPSVY